MDTGSTESFICPKIVKKNKLPILPGTGTVAMASTQFATKIEGLCRVVLKLKDHTYDNFKLLILPGLCADVILGQDFMRQHKSLTVDFDGERSPLKVCALAKLKIEAPALFANLSDNVKPIAMKSRRYSDSDLNFIRTEIEKLSKDGIIEFSTSPWRAQVLVTSHENRKRRMVIDYSQTVNRFTQLDAYPLPKINEMVNKIAKYRVFSKIDLKSAYHQIPIREADRIYTAFEADGRLYQFTRIPFGVTNGVACFQRVMDKFITENNLKSTFAYLDDITVCGENAEEHDNNLRKFMEVARKYCLTLNDQKCSFNISKLPILGHVIENGEIRPDTERTRALRELPIPIDRKSLQRTLGMFSHYSQWIPNFSAKVQPLVHTEKFPLEREASEAFDILKKDVERSVLQYVDENKPFVVETDASDFAIASTLSQDNRPVAFFSRMLNHSERKHSSVEKEAYAIVESLRKWRHFLMNRRFTLITDQKSVSFMFNSKQSGKIKNDKIQRWRLELACYNFDIHYRRGGQNIIADTLSRSVCSSITTNKLQELHTVLCHPGITRLHHFVRMRNLPYSIEDIKKVTSSCPVCTRCKPQFARPADGILVKATQPFERLSLDFKGPLPSCSKNKYMLTIVDEYSRFPFVYPCHDLSSETVIQSLRNLFSIFGMPAYIHTDRGSSFMSSQVQEFLVKHGVSTSRTSPYNPRGNGQVERYNGIIWKTITLALQSLNLPKQQWESVLPVALHSIRSLLCTATNETPHERFFKFNRKSVNGQSLPSWLLTPGPVLLRKHVRSSKYDPLTEEVELISANPNYAHIRKPNGQETTVSVRDLAPGVKSDTNISEFPLIEPLQGVKMIEVQPAPAKWPIISERPRRTPENIEHVRLQNEQDSKERGKGEVEEPIEDSTTTSDIKQQSEQPEQPVLRRSQRIRKSPDRFRP